MSDNRKSMYKRTSLIAVAVVVVAGIATSLAIIDGGREERNVLKLVLGTANRSAAKYSQDAAMAGAGETASMPDMIYWQPTEYSFADGLVFPSGSSTVWAFEASDSTRANMRARVESAVRDLGGTPDEEHIWYDDYAPYYWSYSDYARVASSNSTGTKDSGSDVSGGTSSGSSGGSTEPVLPPDVIDCSLYPKESGCYIEEPVPPANVPSKDEAENLARRFFQSVGLNLNNYRVESWADEWGASVNASLLIDGHDTWMSWSIGFGSNSAVTYAGGYLAGPTSLGEYPLADAATISERLNDYPQIMPMMRDGIEYAISGEGSDSSDTPTSDTVTNTTDPGLAPEPVPSTIIEPSPPVDSTVPIETRRVEIVRAELGLTQFYDIDGRLLLVPAFDLYSDDGLEVSILAVAKEFVDMNTPNEVPLPGVDLPTKPYEPVTTVPPTDSTVTPPDMTPIPQEDADKLLGLSEEEATKVAQSNDWVVRVAEREGKRFALTSDYVPSRVNLTIAGGEVTEVSVG